MFATMIAGMVLAAEGKWTPQQVLELGPGAVLSLRRPMGAAVDLTLGGKVMGRGELVDVDGELGVRVLDLASSRQELSANK